jgi:hypothetical protein
MNDRPSFRELSRPMQAIVILCLIIGLAFTWGVAWGPTIYAAIAR